MSIQTYKDLSLIFGPPAGKFFDNIVSASEQTGISRCEIYEDMLFESFDEAEEKGLFNQIFSSVIGEDLTIGEIFRTKQTFSKARPDIEKLATNSNGLVDFRPPFLDTPWHASGSGFEWTTHIKTESRFHRFLCDRSGFFLSTSCSSDFMIAKATLVLQRRDFCQSYRDDSHRRTILQFYGVWFRV